MFEGAGIRFVTDVLVTPINMMAPRLVNLSPSVIQIINFRLYHSFINQKSRPADIRIPKIIGFSF